MKFWTLARFLQECSCCSFAAYILFLFKDGCCLFIFTSLRFFWTNLLKFEAVSSASLDSGIEWTLKVRTDVAPVPVEPVWLRTVWGTCLQLVLVKDVKEWSELGPPLWIVCFYCQHQASQGGIYFYVSSIFLSTRSLVRHSSTCSRISSTSSS